MKAAQVLVLQNHAVQADFTLGEEDTISIKVNDDFVAGIINYGDRVEIGLFNSDGEWTTFKSIPI